MRPHVISTKSRLFLFTFFSPQLITFTRWYEIVIAGLYKTLVEIEVTKINEIKLVLGGKVNENEYKMSHCVWKDA